MTDFAIKLADIPIGVSAHFQTTKRFCIYYITDEQPEFFISICEKDIDFEREMSAETDKLQGLEPIRYTSAYLETIAVHRKISEYLVDRNTIMFHGSALAFDGECCIFAAKSGTGKSTHSRFWREVYGDRVTMVNDDKPFIKIENSSAVVYGSPWNGKHNLGANISAPLKAICILERDDHNHIEQISYRDALPSLYLQSYRSAEPERLLKTLSILDSMSKCVRFYRLGCNMDPSAAVVACNGIFNGEEK